jgi:hypothetical protein
MFIKMLKTPLSILGVVLLFNVTAAYAFSSKNCEDKCSPLTMSLKTPHEENNVQVKPELYLIFWGPWWTTKPGQSIRNNMTRFLGALHGSPYANILTQYYEINNGHHVHISSNWKVKGIWLNTTNPKNKGINYQDDGSSVLKIATKTIITQEFLSHGIVPTSNTSVLVLPETGPQGYSTTQLAEEGQCQGAHEMMNLPDNTPISVGVTWPGDSTHKQACVLSADTKSASHEWAEMISDPNNTAWLDEDGQELADECSDKYKEHITLYNNGPFSAVVNPLWDKHTKSCALRSSSFTPQASKLLP